MIDHSTGDPTEKRILTKKQVETHIKSGIVELVEMSELLQDTCEHCVDGRSEHGVIGTPGGNAGELVLALTAYEQISGQLIIPEQMDQILTDYLQVAGKFYLHSDEESVAKLGLNTGEDITKIEDEARQNELLKKLVEAENIGCGHLKKMLEAGSNSEHKDDYQVHPELIKEFIKSYFRLLWLGNKNLEFEALPGGHHQHTEGAIVNVVVEGDVNMDTKIPMINPTGKGTSLFVDHPQAVKFMREQTADQSSRFLPEEVNIEELKAKMQELGNKHLQQTLIRLANGLPIYQAVFNDKGDLLQVKEVGIIGN